MLGVTVGVGGYRPLAEQAAAAMHRCTGLPCVVLGDEHYAQAGLAGKPPALLKLRIWDFVDFDDVLLFDADTVCLRNWDPCEWAGSKSVVATRDWIWRDYVQDEAASLGILLEEYFLSSLLILNRQTHEPMFRLATELFPQTTGRLFEQTALNGARHRLGLPIQFLDRRYNWSLFGEGDLHEKAGCIVAHYNSDPLRKEWQAMATRSSDGEISQSAFAELGDRHYRYHRVGHDERALFLRGDGTIGQGGGNAERFWFVRQEAAQRTLCIGSETELICELTLDEDGVWRGGWLNYEQMPVHFMPHRGQVLIDLLGDRERAWSGAEIGVLEGHTSELLLRVLPRLELWMVDRWLTPSPGDRYWEDPFIREIDQDRMYGALSLALQRTRFAEQRRTVIVADQVRAAQSVDDASLDFVFVDSDHSMAGTLEAIDVWWPKLRPAGLMSGHDLDYPEFPGVRQAVEETARRRGLTWHAAPDYFWYFRLPN